MGDRNRNSHNSKEDQTQQISKSIFVTNFPDHFTSQDLWNVANIDQLVENLCNIWIGRLSLHANIVRFQRAQRPLDVQPKKTYVETSNTSFASIHKEGIPKSISLAQSKPALVLDDLCLLERDFSKDLMSKKIASIWGFLMEWEDSIDDSLACKRICLRTKLDDIINEKDNIILHGFTLVDDGKQSPAIGEEHVCVDSPQEKPNEVTNNDEVSAHASQGNSGGTCIPMSTMILIISIKVAKIMNR
ncbi:hypothetical protein Tco_1119511 [Tanacetum coccineum]